MAYRHLWMLVFFIIFNSLQVSASMWSFGLLADLGVSSPFTFVILASPAEQHPVTQSQWECVFFLFFKLTYGMHIKARNVLFLNNSTIIAETSFHN